MALEVPCNGNARSQGARDNDRMLRGEEFDLSSHDPDTDLAPRQTSFNQLQSMIDAMGRSTAHPDPRAVISCGEGIDVVDASVGYVRVFATLGSLPEDAFSDAWVDLVREGVQVATRTMMRRSLLNNGFGYPRRIVARLPDTTLVE